MDLDYRLIYVDEFRIFFVDRKEHRTSVLGSEFQWRIPDDTKKTMNENLEPDLDYRWKIY